jgi:NhaC family Na+:H+ antiporter
VITATILTAIGSNLILCDQYMSIVMTGKMYAQSYKDKGLHPKNLSRAIEDSATVTANLVPWNSGGAYQAATLGVPTIAYLPFNFLLLADADCFHALRLVQYHHRSPGGRR